MSNHINFILNNSLNSIKINPAITLLDFIRQHEKLKGTKEGCREGDCGACTILIGEKEGNEVIYKTINSCLFPIGLISNKHVVTIEGLNTTELTITQHQFNYEGATQCGFCTPGFIVSLTGYLITNEDYNQPDAVNAIAGNICRCTGYVSIIRAIDNILRKLCDYKAYKCSKIEYLVNKSVLPNYFLKIPEKLNELNHHQPKNNLSSILVAGGTDLYIQKEEELLNSSVSFIKSKKMNNIIFESDKCYIGASVTIEQLKNSGVIEKFLPLLKNKLNLFASLPIRNSATIGGNFVNASPIGDSTIIFLALNSQLILNNSGKVRTIPLAEFYKGYKSLDLEQGEILELIVFNLPDDNTFFNFEKVSKRTYLDIASVNSAMKIKLENNIIKSAHISAGGVSPIPMVLYKTSSFLVDKTICSETIVDAVSIAKKEISPISDIRGSAEYKSLLLSQLIKAHFIELFPQSINIDEVLV
jgi:xanthine dehydrogenase small subunit